MSSISSASPRNSDCVTCIWLWMRPGMTMRPERSTRSAPAFSGRPASPGPMSAMAPFSMSMSVSKTSRVGFMVMTVALASSVRMCFLLSWIVASRCGWLV